MWGMFHVDRNSSDQQRKAALPYQNNVRYRYTLITKLKV